MMVHQHSWSGIEEALGVGWIQPDDLVGLSIRRLNAWDEEEDWDEDEEWSDEDEEEEWEEEDDEDWDDEDEGWEDED